MSRPRRAFLVFDLDGTLIDGYEAITDALGYAMERLGETPLPLARVRGMVGHGLETLVAEAVGQGRAAEGVRLFREWYPEVAIAKSHLLPGVKGVLDTLAARGHVMALASNKPAPFSRMILEAKGLGGHFADVAPKGALRIAGPDRETPAKPDPTMLRRLMDGAGATPRDTVAIGDMEVDSEFARAAGCRVVLIPGGSRTREELEAVDKDALLDSIASLPAWLA